MHQSNLQEFGCKLSSIIYINEDRSTWAIVIQFLSVGLEDKLSKLGIHLTYLLRIKFITKLAMRLSSGAKWFKFTENDRDSIFRGIADRIRENFALFNFTSACERTMMAVKTLKTIKVCIVLLLVQN